MPSRIEIHNIKELRTENRIIQLTEGQYFCETPKCYEIWQRKPLLHRVTSVRKTSVLWVYEKESEVS